MHPKKHQHKRREDLRGLVYGGVRVPGFPAWALWMGGYSNMGGGYMTGTTSGTTDAASDTAGDGVGTSTGLGGAAGL